MEPLNLKFVAAVTHGELHRSSGETEALRVTTDSRSVARGDLFVALHGDRFDGHAFVADAIECGACAVMVSAASFDRERTLPAVIVPDTRRALGQLAEAYRLRFRLPVLAVGGSNGKTTTKDLVASVLGVRFAMLASQASFNNDIGVPLTLLRLERRHQHAVLEVGTNHPGELAPLLEIIQPSMGLLTSIGGEHLGFFGDLAAVAREEGAVAECLPSDGTLILNGDAPYSASIAERCRGRVVLFGTQPGHAWRLVDARVDLQGTAFRVEAPSAAYSGEYQVTLVGHHQAGNALAAVIVGALAGLTREEIAAGLLRCAPPKWRLQLCQVGPYWVLNDVYNANADSMKAALRTLSELPCAGRRFAVLGDMAELGAHSRRQHEEVGQAIASARIQGLFTVGEESRVLAEVARHAGQAGVQICEDSETAARLVGEAILPGDMVLVKGSRSMQLERVVEAFEEAVQRRTTGE